MKITIEYRLGSGWIAQFPGLPFESKPLTPEQLVAVLQHWGPQAELAAQQGWTKEQILQRQVEFHRGSWKPKAPAKVPAPKNLTFEDLFGGTK